MRRSENISDLAQALNKCQAELKDVYKASQAYNYNYASLDKVYGEIRPKMVAQGLALTHEKSFNRAESTIELVSLLMHTSGEWIEYKGSLPFSSMKNMNDFQTSGSGFTYLERYQTSAIFGITSDEDKDAHGEQTQQMVSQDQVLQIQNLITGTATDQQTFLTYYKVQNIKDLTAQNATNAIAVLNKKKASL